MRFTRGSVDPDRATPACARLGLRARMAGNTCVPWRAIRAQQLPMGGDRAGAHQRADISGLLHQHQELAWSAAAAANHMGIKLWPADGGRPVVAIAEFTIPASEPPAFGSQHVGTME